MRALVCASNNSEKVRNLLRSTCDDVDGDKGEIDETFTEEVDTSEVTPGVKIRSLHNDRVIGKGDGSNEYDESMINILNDTGHDEEWKKDGAKQCGETLHGDMGTVLVVGTSARNLGKSMLDDAPFRRGVIGCIIDKELETGEHGTATGHNCSLCNKPVHMICCNRLLNLNSADADDSLYCSSCHSKLVQEKLMPQEIVATMEENQVEKSRVVLDNAAVGSNTSLLPIKRPPSNSHLEPDSKRRWRTRSFARIYRRSRMDWDLILRKGHIPVVKRTRAVRGGADIRVAVKFIFRSENIQLLSWGTNRIRSQDPDGKRIEFPAVIRKCTTENIYSRYKSYCECLSIRPLSRSPFLSIVSELTKGQQKRKSAVCGINPKRKGFNART